MKRYKIIFSLFISALLTVTTASAQFDDLYYNPDKDGDLWAQSNETTTSDYQNRDREEQAVVEERANQSSRSEVHNHYYDDYNYYYYSSRIRRFHRPYRGFDYFSSCYTDRYFYNDYYSPGLSIYIGFNSYRPYSSWSNWHYRPYRYRYWDSWNYWHQPWYYGYGPYVVNNYYYGNPYGYGGYGGYYPGHYYYYNDHKNYTNDRGYYYGPRTTGARTTPRDGRTSELGSGGAPTERQTTGRKAPDINTGEYDNTERPGTRREDPIRRTEPSSTKPDYQRGRTNEPAHRTDPNRDQPNTKPNTGGRTTPKADPSPKRQPSKSSGNNNNGRRQEAYNQYDRSNYNPVIERARDRDDRRNRSLFGNERDDRTNRRSYDPFTRSKREYNRSPQRSVKPSGTNSPTRNRSFNRGSKSSSNKSSGSKSSSSGRRK